MADGKTLLAITELGGYSDFRAEYELAGYEHGNQKLRLPRYE